MVYIPPPHLAGGRQSYAHAYNRILAAHRRSHTTSASSVVILVAPDVDALCAVRMLANLFKQDDVNYRIIPVSGLIAFHAIKDDLKQQSDLHTLILINMGIRYDLPTEDWFGELDSKVTIHVLDSARPQSLVNLFMGGESGERVIVWDDGDADRMEEERKSWEVIQYEPRPDSDDEDDEDDGLSDEEDHTDEELEDYEADQQPGGSSPAKRKVVSKSSTRKRLRREKESRISPEEYERHEQRVEKYYTTGTSYGQGAANTIYVLATLLERTDIDMLWLAIIGLTFQYTTARISRTTYDKFQGLYADEVSRLNPIPTEAQNSSTAMNSDDFYVRSTNELRFTLYRHWTVYDAMFHSSYIASKLGLWKEKGRQRLTGLLAKMGFSIPQTQQPFMHMDKDLKYLLQDKLDEIAPEYGLEELNYPSFARCFGYHTQALSAGDAVEGINALLDVAEGIRMEIEVEGMRNGGEWFRGGRIWDASTLAVKPKNAAPLLSTSARPGDGPNPDEGKESGDGGNPMWWRKNFWAAYDSILAIGPLRKSLNLAMSLHRAVIRQGTSIIDKQDIKTMRNHRVVVLSQGPDLNLFAHPGVLSRLALWLVDALRERVAATTVAGSRSKKKGLPIVVACLNEETDQYVVVGVMASMNYGQVLKNEFALTFINATRIIGAELHMDSFDTTIVEVKKHELKAFLTALCT